MVVRTNSYRCQRCGFSARAHHWQCPSCKHWGTHQAPAQRGGRLMCGGGGALSACGRGGADRGAALTCGLDRAARAAGRAGRARAPARARHADAARRRHRHRAGAGGWLGPGSPGRRLAGLAPAGSRLVIATFMACGLVDDLCRCRRPRSSWCRCLRRWRCSCRCCRRSRGACRWSPCCAWAAPTSSTSGISWMAATAWSRCRRW